MRRISLLAFLGLAASCSLAPFSPTTSGRSMGAGNVGAEVGSANSSYYIRTQAGVSPNLDVGYVMEFGDVFSTSSVFGKMSWINNPTGPSLALEGGYGSAPDSNHTYMGLVGSIAFTESFEVFLNARYNWVETDDKDVDLDHRLGHMKLEDDNLKYVIASAGLNVWFNQNSGLSLFGTQGFGDRVKWEEGVAAGASFLFRF